MYKALKEREESKVVSITKVLLLKMTTYDPKLRYPKINNKSNSLKAVIFDILYLIMMINNIGKLYLNMILIILAIFIIISLIIIITTPKIIV